MSGRGANPGVNVLTAEFDVTGSIVEAQPV